MTQKTVWCLNNAIDLVGPNQEAIIAEFGAENIKFGSRPQSKSTSETASYKTNNLMPGCEYFVPIAPKCIGSDFLTPDLNGYLQKIQQYYNEKGQNNYTYFWSSSCMQDRGYQMITNDFQGYYSLLKATKPNILIGYSQGGLVARYLEWLDKVVYGNAGVVAGIITVSSPNFGSPLANFENKAYILKGLIKIGLIFLTGKTSDLILDALADLIYGLISLEGDPLTEIVNLLNDIIKELQKAGDKFIDLINSIQNLINWMGGLRDDPNNAFFDLNINRIDDASSVLASVNSADSLNRYGILSTNNNVEDIINPQGIEIMQRHIKNYINTKRNRNSSYDILNNYIPVEAANMDQEDYDKMGQIYNDQIMMEHLSNIPSNPIINRIIGDYRNGIEEVEVKAKAHDFIIPSSYQLTFENGIIDTDRNQPNFDANHLTGSSLKYKAGGENYEYIMGKLRDIMR